MADSCGLLSAAGKEKVWLDKSSYDKAECIYQEKLAKVLPPKITDNNVMSNATAPVELQTSPNANPAPKKSKKVKDNKLAGQENSASEMTKNTKNSKKNKKKEALKAAEASADNVAIKSEDSEVAVCTASAKKAKAKEAKEENNKADKDAIAMSSKKAKAKEAKEENNKADKKQRNLVEDKGGVPGNKERLSSQESQLPAGGSLASEVAKARQHIKQSLQCMDGIAALAGVADSDIFSQVNSLEKENHNLKNIVQELKNIVTKLDSRVKDLEEKVKSVGPSENSVPQAQVCPKKPAPKKEEKKEEEDDDVDLFGSDSEGEDAEAAKIREERVAAYAAKKSKKPTLIAKSSLILDVKPWDDETDMKELETEVRKIQTDGLLWGASKLVPVAYNIKKLQITCVVEDDKVSIDWLTEQITEIEDFVQSVDIAAFNKI